MASLVSPPARHHSSLVFHGRGRWCFVFACACVGVCLHRTFLVRVFSDLLNK